MNFGKLILCPVVLFLFGCSSSYLADESLVLYPPNLSQPDARIQERSFQALLDSFTENRWEIRKIDKEQGIINAEACRRGEYCSEVQATVKKDGSIEITRAPGEKLSEDEGKLLQRWLGRVKNSYNKRMR